MAGGFLEWSSNLCASLGIYNRAMFNLMKVQERPSETDDSHANAEERLPQEFYKPLTFTAEWGEPSAWTAQ